VNGPVAVLAAGRNASLAVVEQVEGCFDGITDVATRRGRDRVAVFESCFDDVFEGAEIRGVHLNSLNFVVYR